LFKTNVRKNIGKNIIWGEAEKLGELEKLDTKNTVDKNDYNTLSIP